jgi:hypothetical protein
MAAHICVSSESSVNTSGSSYPKYWSAENHSASDGNIYLRAEEWLKDLDGYTLPVRNSVIQINIKMGEAIMRYREELKMYAAIADQEAATTTSATSTGRHTPAMEDPTFLDTRHSSMKLEWPAGQQRAEWWGALEDLRVQLDDVIKTMPSGAFVKFSVRSPKDSAAVMASYKAFIQEHVETSNIAPDSELALGADVSAIKYANWKALMCRSGEDALLLLLRSERIYIDILQHELFCKGNREAFDLKLHVFEFFSGFDPDWEFRAFMSDGKRTAITLYNPWVHSQQIIDQKEAILGLMYDIWDKVESRIRSANYSLDFAVAPDLSGCWIVELNNFLPPLAGCGLFDFYDINDRNTIINGPFEFRIRTAPVTESDFIRVKVDEVTGVKTTLTMQPSSPELMRFTANARRRAFGLPVPLEADLDTQQSKYIKCSVM